jgi:hypothetical protein
MKADRMSRMRAPWLMAFVVAGALAPYGIVAGSSASLGTRQAKAPAVDADHARLLAMTGEWAVDMTLWPRPGGRGLQVKGTSTIRPLFDGLFIEEKIEASLNGSPVSTLAWTGFNPATHQYEATRLSSTSAARIAETGAYDDTTKQFELKADYAVGQDTWHQRTIIQMTSQDAMIATSYLSFAAVPEWKGVEIKYTRKAR